MKKKGGNSRTKNHDNGKDDGRSHRHSKRRKKSTTSDSDSSSEVDSRKQERSERRKRTRDRSNKSKNEIGSVKSTRHSRRLAVSDDSKEIANERPTHVTIKLTKSGSSRETSREPKKKDSPSTSDGTKQKSKDGNVWKVKSSNGSGGELQKLKICRQRTAEDDEVNNHEDSSAVVNDEDNASKMEESTSYVEKSDESVQSVIEKVPVEDQTAEIRQEEHNERDVSEVAIDKEETSSEEVDGIQQDVSPIIGETSPAKRYETGKESEVAIVATSEQELEDERLVVDRLPLSTDQPLDTLNIDDNTVMKEDEEEEKQKSTTEEENQQPLQVGVEGIIDDIQLEEYDYENDEIREEGEVSTQDDSPAYQAYHKIPAQDRKRSWGVCNIFQFPVATIECSEKLLKIHDIKKKIITRMDSSSSLTLCEEDKPKEERQSVRTVRKKISSPLTDSDGHKAKKSDTSEHKEHGRYRKEEDEHGGRTVLYITNLVRPFTLTQLRELLQRTGKIADDGFWIDAIKSKCYVQYEKPDEAFETKQALDGTRWPANNPKVLCVRYSTQDDLLKAQTQTEVSEIPRKTEPLQLRDERLVNWKHFEERPRKVTVNVREWDIGKPAYPDEMIVSGTTIDRNVKRKDINDNRDLKKRSYKAIAQSPQKENTEPEVKKERKIKEKTQSKQLDDLFIRTKALPSIYWLPLTPSQVEEKEGKHRTIEPSKDKGRSINNEHITCDIKKEEDKRN